MARTTVSASAVFLRPKRAIVPIIEQARAELLCMIITRKETHIVRLGRRWFSMTSGHAEIV